MASGALACLPTVLAAQQIPSADSATLGRASAHAAVVHWVDSLVNPSDQVVRLKNTSSRVVQVESFEVYECINVAPSRVCKVHEGGQMIRPGKTITLVTLGRRSSYDAWSYRYRFQVRFVTDSVTTAPAMPQQGK